MKAILSTTYDDLYLFFLPLTIWSWNKLGIEAIIFLPKQSTELEGKKIWLATGVCDWGFGIHNELNLFVCTKDKEPTYAQCSRLYGACLELPQEEWLITADIDMAIFNEPVLLVAGKLSGNENATIVGHDLVGEGQFPICYCCASVKGWREFMKINNRTYQECLDDLLGKIECEHMKGNYWCADQEELYNKLTTSNIWINKAPRANPGTMFATRRLDRDDGNMMERISPDIIDFHMPRPGYTKENFAKILTVFQTMYPGEDFTWMQEYRNEYVKLL